MSKRTLKTLCESIGYQFNDLELLRQALKHPSYTHENPRAGDNNQRLEFLGDAVVGVIVAELLIRLFPEAREGQLTQWRAALVSEKPLAKAARQIGLGDLLLLGRGEDHAGGRERPSVLSDAFEAVVGAAFLDGGLEAARSVIEMIHGERIREVANARPIDHKSKLQEDLQARSTCSPLYEVVNVSGPDHARRYEVHIIFDDEVLGTGEGSSKKVAEQNAAKHALEKLDHEEVA